jgi:oxepin-CoA hydrolase/3-oxo-5,6-dehydrosuberyl-CoA semialdehyde dehydrogenase
MNDKSTIQDWLLLLMELREDVTPKWGIMESQHLIEHISATFAISNGKLNAEILTPPEKIAHRKGQFFQPETVFPRGILAPGSKPEAPFPKRFASFDEAKVVLAQNVERFFKYYEDQPIATPSHPFFGPLSEEEWLFFHVKHLRHHLTQFGLIPELE